jgi:hypothetical protein
MKALLIILLVLVGSLARAQQEPYRFSPLPLDTKSHQVVYTATMPVAGISKAQLLSRTQEWAAQLARRYQTTTARLDAETSTLTTRVTLKNGQESYGCQVLVRTQDGAYQYVLSHVTRTEPAYARAGKYSPATPTTSPIETLVYTRPTKYRDKKLAEIDTLLRRLLSDLNQRLLNPADGLAQQQ